MSNSNFAKECSFIKEYQNLIGKIAIAVVIIIAGVMISNAIAIACGEIGSQIASALSIIASQID